MQIDANAVIDNLLSEIAEKSRTIAMLKAQLSAMQAAQPTAAQGEAADQG